MTIYTQRLAAGQVTSGGVTIVYTKPADGTTVVVRDICMESIAGSDHTLLEVILPGGEECPLFAVRPAEALTSYHWSGRQVLQDGDQLAVYTGGPDIHYIVTGYVLR
jgi:hypothetical protein